MKLRESIHNELVTVYNTKNSTIQERYELEFAGVTNITEDMDKIGYFMLRETINNEGQLNEGIFDFFGNLFGGLGGNIGEQLKEWAIGKVLDWMVKPVVVNLMGANQEFYNHIKKFIQVTFADIPLGEVMSTITDCTKMTKIMILGFSEFMLATVIEKLSLTGVIADTLRQELDKTFIEGSDFITGVTEKVAAYVCPIADQLRDNVSKMNPEVS